MKKQKTPDNFIPQNMKTLTLPQFFQDFVLTQHMNFSGGITLTLSGYGFSPSAEVTIGSKACEVTSTGPVEIGCIIPEHVSNLPPSLMNTKYGNRLHLIPKNNNVYLRLVT